MALYAAFIPVLYSGCCLCAAASYPGNADAAKDDLLHTHADLIYQEAEKRVIFASVTQPFNNLDQQVYKC